MIYVLCRIFDYIMKHYYKRIIINVCIFCVGLFYYLLGNLKPEFRSSLKVIQLVTLVRHSFIKDYGIDKILEPFMDDIKLLESVSHTNSHYKITMLQSRFLQVFVIFSLCVCNF